MPTTIEYFGWLQVAKKKLKFIFWGCKCRRVASPGALIMFCPPQKNLQGNKFVFFFTRTQSMSFLSFFCPWVINLVSTESHKREFSIDEGYISNGSILHLPWSISIYSSLHIYQNAGPQYNCPHKTTDQVIPTQNL